VCLLVSDTVTKASPSLIHTRLTITEGLQLCLGVLCQSRSFHHLPCFHRSLPKGTHKFIRVELKARDCPANVVITYRIGEAVSVWHNCAERGKRWSINHREEPCTDLPRIPIRRETWMTIVMSIAPSDSCANMLDPRKSLVEFRPPRPSSSAQTDVCLRPGRLRPTRRTAHGAQPQYGTARRAVRPNRVQERSP
jgi:hypothetical protein